MDFSPYLVTRFQQLDAESDPKAHPGEQVGQWFEGWAAACLSVLQRTFGSEHPYYTHFLQHLAQTYSVMGGDADSIPLIKLQRCKPIFHKATLEYIEDISARAEISVLGTMEILDKIISNFSRMVQQFAHRRKSRPPFLINDEADAQDLLHAVLQLFFEDIRPEIAVPGSGGKTLFIDFLLKREKIGIEVKGPDLTTVEARKQLHDDIAEYRRHPDCKTLLILVYDPARGITNPRGLEEDLSAPDAPMPVKVFVVQP